MNGSGSLNNAARRGALLILSNEAHELEKRGDEKAADAIQRAADWIRGMPSNEELSTAVIGLRLYAEQLKNEGHMQSCVALNLVASWLDPGSGDNG